MATRARDGECLGETYRGTAAGPTGTRAGAARYPIIDPLSRGAAEVTGRRQAHLMVGSVPGNGAFGVLTA
jgi:hypothetical protein